MKAVVTGGAGLIGSHLVDQLIALGFDVHVIDNLSTGDLANVHPKATLHQLDIRSQEAKNVIKKERPAVVFHQAAQVVVQCSIRDPKHDASVNILGTINMLEACCEASVQAFVYASSCAVYGDLHAGVITEEDPVNPISFYGASKLAPELYIRVFHQMYGLPYTILRYANVYGPRQTPHSEGGVVAIFLDRIRRGLPLLIHGDGEQTRDFVYVKDAVRANIAAMYRNQNRVIQVGTATATSINQLVAMLRYIHCSEIKVTYEPERPGDIKHSCLDYSQNRRQLLWSPQYDLLQGLTETYSSVMKRV
ncbi:NAD-dependent epimerase/dehydratase family protein [Tumebacillus lipolyticus]|uniref:NAD-dependent epimerase/dehydratase family protein n=1 Tax=Tumebacillus lipolyticus TaxID=1280370 RepID=A0ABW4ZT34_9BACL